MQSYERRRGNERSREELRGKIPRRDFLVGGAGAAFGGAAISAASAQAADEPSKGSSSNAGKRPALLAITFDLEMSRHYPRRGMLEWDYQKGNLDGPTKQYSVKAAEIAKDLGGVIHYFCVGRVLEQANVDWLKQIAAGGHPIGNHTYDHVNVLAKSPEQTQFRFSRAPWLVRGKSAAEVIRSNVALTTAAMEKRIGIKPNGFRTPGGFSQGLAGREDIQRLLLGQGFKWVSAKYPSHRSGKPKQPPTDDVYASIVDAQKRAQPFVYPTGLIEVPMSPISDVTAFRSRFWKREYFLKAVRLAVEWAIETGGVFDFLCHPSCMVVEDPKFETVRLICKLANEAGERARVVGCDALAARAVR